MLGLDSRWFFLDIDPKWNGLRNGTCVSKPLVRGQEREEKLAITNTLAGKNLGMVLLAIWLILTGLIPLLNVRISATVNTVLAVLAIVAGLLILLRR